MLAAAGNSSWSVAARAVDVWCFQTGLDKARDRDQRLLSAQEQERLAALRNPRERRDFLQGRVAIRCILGGYLGRAPERVTFRMGEFGKPHVATGLHCNWTHSSGAWVLAVTEGGPIGVDIERLDRSFAWREPASVAFHPDETAFVEAAWEDPLTRSYEVWTQKEALLKAIGTGLHDDMSGMAVARPAAGLAGQIRSSDGRIWHLSRLATRQNLTAAMATSFVPSRIVYRLTPKAGAPSGDVEMTSLQLVPRALSKVKKMEATR